jgi:hypothetical protein
VTTHPDLGSNENAFKQAMAAKGALKNLWNA